MALASLMLLLVSLYGLVTDPFSDYKNKFRLAPAKEMYEALDRSYARDGWSESFVAEFIKRFRMSMNYEWPADVQYMPIQENWILFSLRSADPFISEHLLRYKDARLFGNVELPTYELAMQRGFGICSQLSLAGADLLHSRYGIDARVAGLNGHVVIQVIDTKSGDWVIDPSFKTYAKGSVNRPEDLPVRFFDGNNNIRSLYFDSNSNYVSSQSGWGEYSHRSGTKQKLFFNFVLLSYYLKWLLPLSILLVYGLACIRSAKSTGRILHKPAMAEI